MNDLSYDADYELARTTKDVKEKPRKKRVPRWAALLTVLLIWLAIGYGGYTLAKNYVEDIQTKLDRVADTNETQMKDLNEKLTALQTALDTQKTQAEALDKQFAAVENELTAVKEEMSLAGDSLSKTADTKKALNSRITDLSNQLTELRKLITKLEAAVRVY
ncbi:hypothetical protein [Gorillibacterium massiliense]|uniref:hypothetical protein n=1 Tax=Gorillibacterium massiliense TaxID=1280390 RepID=UPI0004BA4A4B|nr:hypothetical protein [Gorillibacterium massiliense]